jgi:uncharacterized protein involved in outer membrane biogenesis
MLKRVLLVLLAAVLVASGALYLVPLSSYIPPIEQAAAAALGQPVTVAGLRLVLLPMPHATLSGIRIGPGGEVAVDELSIVPALGSLLSSPRVLRKVELKGVAAPADFLPALVPRGKAEGSAAVRVEQVALKDVKLALAAGPVPAFDVQVDLSAAGRPQRLRAATRDGKLTLEAVAEGDLTRVKAKAREWTLPAGAPLRVDELGAVGELHAEGLLLKAIDGKLYGGTLAARGELRWDKGFAVDGDVTLQGVAMEPLLAVFAHSGKMSGRLDTRAHFSATARDAGKLADVLRADGSFVVRDGVLHNVDLAQAARLMGASHTRGGSTKFDELTGNYHVAGRSYRLERLQVLSGLLTAQGNVAIAPSRQLDGKVNVELKSGVALVVVPLRVAGTTQDPVLYPTGAAVAGAAAGTAVLGPGVGTTLGVRVGDALEGLFGGKKK